MSGLQDNDLWNQYCCTHCCEIVGAYLEGSMSDIQMPPLTYLLNSYFCVCRTGTHRSLRCDHDPFGLAAVHRNAWRPFSLRGHTQKRHCKQGMWQICKKSSIKLETDPGIHSHNITQKFPCIFIAHIFDAFSWTLPSIALIFLIISTVKYSSLPEVRNLVWRGMATTGSTNY